MPTRVSPAASLSDLQIKTVPGTYVEGRLTCPDGSADLILKQDGHEPRSLLLEAQDEHDFRFVAGAHAVTLCVRKKASSRAEVRITRTVAPEDQGTGNAGEACAAPLSPRLLAVARGELAAGMFWQQVVSYGTPMVEPDPQGNADRQLLTFLWRGTVRNVCLIGGPSPDHVWMKRLAGTNIWFASFSVPLDLRLSYRLAPDVPDINATPRENRLALLAVARSDPMNKRLLFADTRDPFAQWSVFEPKDTSRPRNQILGRVSHDVAAHRIADSALLSGRKIWVHRTAGFVPGAPGNILQIIFDGATYLHQLDLPGMIEEQVQRGALPSVATVFVDAVSSQRRSEDLACDDRFTRLLVDHVIPFASERIGQRFAPDQVVVSGSSFGGLASAFAALKHPKKVGNFVSLSGSFWWQPMGGAGTEPYLTSLPVNPGLRAVLTAGCYETARDKDDVGIFESTSAFAEHLNQHGAFARTHTFTGGHDYAVWAPALIEALKSLFGPNCGTRQMRT